MVKCPRGTPSQVRANLQYSEKPSSLSFESDFFAKVVDPVIDLVPESSDSELDSIRADKRVIQTAKTEVVYFFISYFLDILLESWEGKPCKKTKLHPFSWFSKEFFGEMDLAPCEDSSDLFTADTLKNIYQQRPSNLTTEKSYRKKSKSSETIPADPDAILAEDDYEAPEIEHWNTNVPDEDVKFTLQNGVWYNGRVSKRLMDGTGVYFWEDGALYEGEFEDGCVTGKGRLEFPDLSVYEGGVYKAFRHGEGMHCLSHSPVMYSGQWWLGLKHGYGMIVYENPANCISFYRGYWEKGLKEGFGYRQYPTGSKYIGFWSNGKRHGYGIMLWSNNDIYKGEWKEGLMHGYGEYTWNGFVNKSLSYPASNTFRGIWSEGLRNGQGILEVKNGPIIETIWVNNIKEGPGAVVCCNGTVIVAELLFSKDREASSNNKEDKTGLLLRDQFCKTSLKRVEQEHSFLDHLTRTGKKRTIQIPIYASVHLLALEPHTQKYYLKKKEELIRATAKSEIPFRMIRIKSEMDEESSQQELSDENDKQLLSCASLEEQFLRNSIIAKITSIKACYEHYSTIACEEKPAFKCVLLRLFMWQLFIDANIPEYGLSLVDIDNVLAQEECLLIENPHNPFECIQLWQFIHSLLVLSWYLYAQFVFIKEPLSLTTRIINFLDYFENLPTKYVLKAAFEYFVENDILKGRFNGNYDLDAERERMFEEMNLAPMEGMYKTYKQVGEPHTAKQFIRVFCRKTEGSKYDTDITGTIEKLPDSKLEWKNALTVAGELTHISAPIPFNSPEQTTSQNNLKEKEYQCNLPYFKNLSPKQVVKCISQICPGFVCEDVITNMDYKITFLEFYKIMILCTESVLKLELLNSKKEEIIENYKKQMEEYEKALYEQEKSKEKLKEKSKEGNTGSGKKSRQRNGSSKKAKK